MDHYFWTEISLVHRQGNFCPCMSYMQSGQDVLSYLPKYIRLNKKFVSRLTTSPRLSRIRYLFSILGSFCTQKSCLLSDCRVDKHEWNLRLLLKLGSRLNWPKLIEDTGFWYFSAEGLFSLLNSCVLYFVQPSNTLKKKIAWKEIGRMASNNKYMRYWLSKVVHNSVVASFGAYGGPLCLYL